MKTGKKIITELRRSYIKKLGFELYHLDEEINLFKVVDEMQLSCVCGHTINNDAEIIDFGVDKDEFELPGNVAKCIYCDIGRVGGLVD